MKGISKAAHAGLSPLIPAVLAPTEVAEPRRFRSRTESRYGDAVPAPRERPHTVSPQGLRKKGRRTNDVSVISSAGASLGQPMESSQESE